MTERISSKEKTIWAVILLAALPLAAWSLLFWRQPLLHVMQSISVYLYLIPAAIVDRKKKIIPNQLLPFGLGICVLFRSIDLLTANDTLLSAIVMTASGLFVGAGVFAVASLLSGGGVGMGDIKLFGVLGLILQADGVFALLFYTLLCTAAGGVALFAAGKATAKTRIALAPFALAGAAAMMLAGG